MAKLETVANPLLLRGRLIVLKRGNTNRKGLRVTSEDRLRKYREAAKRFSRGNYRGRFVAKTVGSK